MTSSLGKKTGKTETGRENISFAQVAALLEEAERPDCHPQGHKDGDLWKGCKPETRNELVML